MYKRLSPDSTGVRLLKVAPGEKARFWDDCRSGGYICVGWDEVGDLRKFKSPEDFKAAFKKRCSYSPAWKANELWTLMELRRGDRIVANNGLTKVVGVGTVKEPGYKWMPGRSREGYCHTVAVQWDKTKWGASDCMKIPRQPWNNTVKSVSLQVFERVSGESLPKGSIVTTEAVKESKKRLLRMVRQRLGQQRFREDLLHAYNSRCAISGCEVPQALEAAHIDPDRSATPSNGLLLRADFHLLFDSLLMAVEPRTVRVHLSPALRESKYWRFQNKRIRLPEVSHLRPDPKLLANRYRLFVSA